MVGERGLKLNMQAGGAQVGFKAGVPRPCAACAPPWGMSACKGEGFSTGAPVYTENPCFPLSSSVAKATVIIGITCCQGFVRPQTSFTQGFTHRLFCSILYSSKRQYLYTTNLKK